MAGIFKLNRTSIWSIAAALLMVFAAANVPWTHEQPQAAANVEISLEQFARYVDEWSEEEGYFDSDNFITNETSYLHVVDQLERQVKPGGVYLGVGPDQNFSYVVHTKPTLAVITDIRRQNMLEHLWYKALFTLASNRLEYLSLLVSREVPRSRPDASLDQMLHAVDSSATSESLFQKNLAAIRNVLLDKFRLKLSSTDLRKIAYVYQTFWQEGLGLRFSSIGRNNALNYATLEEMLQETDRQGRERSYLASEELFQQLKKFQTENRLIPIVGDFAGSRAFKAVGAFLRANGLRVSTFYTSNVEFYIFSSPGWFRFVSNVRALPLTDDAIFIRSYFGNGRQHPLNVRGHRSTSLVKPIGQFLADYDARRLNDYWDVVKP